MILKALYDYFERSGDTTPTGFTTQKISFAIGIDEEGNFIGIEDLRDEKHQGKSMIVPKGARSGTVIRPYIFWDNVEYFVGYNPENPESATRKNTMLVELYRTIAKQYPENREMEAVCRFYDSDFMPLLQADALWKEIEKKPAVNLTFHVKGYNTCVAECKDLKDYVSRTIGGDIKEGDGMVCLITGNKTNPVATTSPTGIQGGQATGRLVAFQVNSGYDSYGKTQALNAPISPEAESAYTSALKRLLDKDSRNKLVVGDGSYTRTFVFWAECKSEVLADETEQFMAKLFGKQYVSENNDNPDRGVGQIKELYKSIWSGHHSINSDDRFYILGLAPNSARIAVVYWRVCSIKELGQNVEKHLEDMSMVGDGRMRYPFVGIHSMLSQVTLDGKSGSASPNLPEALFKSITEGRPYPFPLYKACISRIRAEQKVTIARAAIAKAYLNRNNYKNIKFTKMLNRNINDPGYLCGRLFAVLELAQEKATPGLNSTIRNRYITSASTSPSSVFPTLLNLSFHHIDKLPKGMQIFYEKEKGSIIDLLDNGCFPAHLDLNEQGCFMVGYYQQRQDFFQEKEAENEVNND